LAPGAPWNRVERAPATAGHFIEGAYTNRAGTRAYKLYLPSGYCGQALPLVVMLHGCTQDPDDFAAGTRMNALAEQEQFLVVYPAQAAAANPAHCWNWFQAAHQHPERGEPSLLAGITRHLLSAYAINAHHVYVAGLSAGGAMAVILGESYPDLYAAVGVHSGLAYGAAHDLPSALAAMRYGRRNAAPRRHRDPAVDKGTRMVPTIVFHGDRDTTVHPCNGDQILADGARRYAGGGPDPVAGTKLRVTVSRGQTPGGRAYTRARYRDAHGYTVLERWLVHEAGHRWSGGSPQGTFTDPQGPDASRAMIRFFNQQAHHEP
jgi:poly(hydroxyalkanoate) depolymerase family esterase